MMIRFLAILAAAMLAASGAQAHAFLTHSQPAVGSTVAAPPKALVLSFTEGVVPPFSSVTVATGAGAAVPTGKLATGNTQRELIVPLPELAPGTYTVTWHVTAEDTHKTEGHFTFTVAH